MLLKEERSTDSTMCYYDSSNVVASKYIPEKYLLAVIYSNGRQYIYEKVTEYHHAKFKVADSQGKAVKEAFGNLPYSFKMTDEEQLNQIKEFIKNLKKEKNNEV